MTTVTLLAVAMMPMISTPDHLQQGFPAEGASQLHQVRMVGKDTRTAVPEKFRKIASGIGKVIDSKGKNCTAFCVAPNAVVTNAHCLAFNYIKKKKAHQTRNLSNFLFLLDDETTSIEQQAIKPLGNPYLSTITIYPAKLRSVSGYNDWIIARLSEPVCTGNVLKIADEKTTKQVWIRGGMRVVMIGWPSSPRGNQTYETCWMAHPQRRSNSISIPHLCDSKKGQSGSPLLTRTKKGWRVVAIHRGSWTFYKGHRDGKYFGPGKPRSFHKINHAIGIGRVRKMLPAFLDAKFVTTPMKQVEFQKMLQREGSLFGKAEDKYSSRVFWAIRRYQKNNNMAPLGIPTMEMIEKLKAGK